MRAYTKITNLQLILLNIWEKSRTWSEVTSVIWSTRQKRFSSTTGPKSLGVRERRVRSWGLGLLNEYGTALRVPFKDIQFVGTVTALIFEWTGYMDGAFSVGERVTKECLSRIGEKRMKAAKFVIPTLPKTYYFFWFFIKPISIWQSACNFLRI